MNMKNAKGFEIRGNADAVEDYAAGRFKSFLVSGNLALAFRFDFDYVSLGRPDFAEYHQKETARECVNLYGPERLPRARWTRKLPSNRDILIVDAVKWARARMRLIQDHFDAATDKAYRDADVNGDRG